MHCSWRAQDMGPVVSPTVPALVSSDSPSVSVSVSVSVLVLV